MFVFQTEIAETSRSPSLKLLDVLRRLLFISLSSWNCKLTMLYAIQYNMSLGRLDTYFLKRMCRIGLRALTL